MGKNVCLQETWRKAMWRKERKNEFTALISRSNTDCVHMFSNFIFNMAIDEKKNTRACGHKVT